ncbi:hypothetical protein [Egicoccus halophilus]|uniref:hypothetical protein n=1 Tax=Egicoccus halophilus TaxID=1670830 RepID=UPI0010314882|nr:hypothetical protein [Egicoccus halophilus]
MLGAATVWVAATWVTEPPGIAAAPATTEAATGGANEATLRLHVTPPRYLVAGHPSPVGLALTDTDGRPLPADTRLVVSAELVGIGNAPVPVVLDAPPAWPVTAGELVSSPLRLLPTAEPACDTVVAQLRVRVTPVEERVREAETVRDLRGPVCDGGA